ncbi:1-deoxy-D-xylulose-5-phosphate synthase [Candidatus Neptunochlamydia vexilliferae]|uniref:1-deoxy-D-xylulose-5-phosphate synthase n=2 Tax=Candidatus Neptunichlamydia vexilliferae TaxID=1651774 RepID=A0ABS0AYN3_9BACT|nr:1-deoxy-D-xylulose-5-phosphate synthase [Candidatus Neptunochlamydia vexilliferae]
MPPPMTPILDTLTHPQQLKEFSHGELKRLAEEIRVRVMDVLSVTGGHLSSNLGIVELTIALHRVFNSPEDKFIFDVGHQSYIHKLLTGRNPLFPTIRQTDGLSGFVHPPESPHDHFFTGHAGNALSLALGMAKNRDLRGQEETILPILGDAALTCGLTLEAMNNIPRKTKKFLVVLNDNAMSISKNVGAITGILSRFFNSPTANNIYEELTEIVSKIPGYGETLAKQGNKMKESMKNLISTAPFFEQFGLSYVGPIDGHDIKKLVDTFEALKEVEHPTLVHVLTVKGQGMQNAINNPTPYHGAKPFNRVTGEFLPPKSSTPSFPKVFGSHLLKMADEDPNIVAITPAMPVGSCLDPFMKKYPERCIDVGIAEGHSLTYAGGIAREGKLKVVTSVYSSFLQRAFDSVYHDICVQNSPVVIAIDRAGLATGDGVTAQGLYDISYLGSMPNMVIAQPRNGHVLKELFESAFDWRSPAAIRYPNLPTDEDVKPLYKRQVGKGEVLAEGKDVVILSLGHLDQVALKTRELLAEEGISAAVIDPVFIKPLDKELLLRYFQEAEMVVTIEEHALQGGLGSMINTFILQNELSHLRVKNFGIPDQLIEHGKHSDLLERYGITPENIAKALNVQVAS